MARRSLHFSLLLLLLLLLHEGEQGVPPGCLQRPPHVLVARLGHRYVRGAVQDQGRILEHGQQALVQLHTGRACTWARVHCHVHIRVCKCARVV